jgi:hypothetical protein
MIEIAVVLSGALGKKLSRRIERVMNREQQDGTPARGSVGNTTCARPAPRSEE